MIPYLGDKSKIFDFLKPHLPKNPKRWIEPFGGGFNLYFSLNLNEYPDTEFIYNDINPLNSNLFSCLKKESFIRKVMVSKVDKDIFEESFNNLNSKDKEVKAISWLMILCCGDIKNLMSKEFRGNSQYEILKYKLPRYIEYFKRIKVYNQDYKKILKKYDDIETFFYLDPPYFGYENYYINHNFKNESHEELSLELKILKSKWILSYYNFEGINEWYSNYDIISKKHNLSEEYFIINN
jgi:DNA adenine methylase